VLEDINGKMILNRVLDQVTHPLDVYFLFFGSLGAGFVLL
jgi:hypothetical protein